MLQQDRYVFGVKTQIPFHTAALYFHYDLPFSFSSIICVPTGVPPHVLNLSEGSVAMIMRNMHGRFSNGKRVVVLSIANKFVHVVDADVYDGRQDIRSYPTSATMLVPRINFSWRYGRAGLALQRSQFPLRPAYAVTFNKSQGKTLQRAVVDLRNPSFAHGQLYVALSRVRTRNDIMVLCDPATLRRTPYGHPCHIVTMNVVERKSLERAYPPQARAAFQQQFPVPPPPLGMPVL